MGQALRGACLIDAGFVVSSYNLASTEPAPRRDATIAPGSSGAFLRLASFALPQFQTEGGTVTGSAGTSVATETCGQLRVLKFSRTVCEY